MSLHYGIFGAALPSIKAGLRLNYNQLGMLLGLPGLVNTAIEPVLMILGDTNQSRNLIALAGLAVCVQDRFACSSECRLPKRQRQAMKKKNGRHDG